MRRIWVEKLRLTRHIVVRKDRWKQLVTKGCCRNCWQFGTKNESKSSDILARIRKKLRRDRNKNQAKVWDFNVWQKVWTNIIWSWLVLSKFGLFQYISKINYTLLVGCLRVILYCNVVIMADACNHYTCIWIYSCLFPLWRLV